MRGAIILAGGPSRRLGRPKAFLTVGGVPLLVRVATVAKEVAEEVVVVTRGGFVSRVERLLPSVIVARDSSRIRSPLVGLQAGGAAVSGDYVAALPCDLPFVAPALLRRLFSAAQRVDAAIPQWPNGMIEPLVAVYNRQSLLNGVRAALGSGERSNQSMIDRLERVKFVEVSLLRSADPRLLSFLNVNTPADLAHARRMSAQIVRRLRKT